MKTYFYIRVSSREQNTIRQEVKAKEHNIPVENVYIEKASGKNIIDRPVLSNMMAILKSGDKLIVDSISRFARNTKDLIELVDQLNNKGVIFVSLKEAIDTTTPTGMFMLTIFGAVAQLERDYLKDRQMEGIAIAVTEGKYKGRKPIEYPKLWDKYYKMMSEGNISGIDVMKILDLKKTTFYKLVKQYKESIQ
ncbi:recombinase family protein [Clostridium estertheticum]|uniref:recombinase family protein n=1 Tax=Clostridium estertheticum TaxID=238834 RepID=UPI001C0E718A|nr:recombinase family protein [Clostridium estertheticum]MBU3187607.1 recombinase family protein [Clostridium estertheticum]